MSPIATGPLLDHHHPACVPRGAPHASTPCIAPAPLSQTAGGGDLTDADLDAVLIDLAAPERCSAPADTADDWLWLLSADAARQSPAIPPTVAPALDDALDSAVWVLDDDCPTDSNRLASIAMPIDSMTAPGSPRAETLLEAEHLLASPTTTAPPSAAAPPLATSSAVPKHPPVLRQQSSVASGMSRRSDTAAGSSAWAMPEGAHLASPAKPSFPASSLPASSMTSRAATSVAVQIVANIAVAVAIVLVNKHVLKTFPSPLLLTLAHQLTCAAVTRPAVLGALGVPLAPTRIPARDAAIAGVTNVAGLVLMNASLRVNPVGVHQLAKLSGVPAIAALQWTLFGAPPPGPRSRAALGVLLVGVALATFQDFGGGSSDDSRSGGPLGLALAAAAVVSTALAQVTLQHLPSFRGVSGMQTVAAMSPWSSAALLAAAALQYGPGPLLHWLVGTVSDAAPELATSADPAIPWVPLLASCALAVGANAVGNGLIKSTSAITYNVVGHLKTLIILAAGAWMFDGPPTAGGGSGGAVRAVGIAASIAGMAAYTYFQSTAAPAPPASGDGGDKKPRQRRVVVAPPMGPAGRRGSGGGKYRGTI
ncbi:hypothetical protein H9P43_002291 [Blastocladiella emersonii ATCC 22665]|nr:hypothetical protein H9P43_002291 [Blastocladiella emersonii ATCC 22665]